MEMADTPLNQVRAKIGKACKVARRDPDEITLVAVSKKHAPTTIRPLLDQGHVHFGENRVQEAQAKWPDLREDYPNVQLHLVGQLQSNKAEDAVTLFDCIHSLDRSSLVTALAKAFDKLDKRTPCFVQVDVGKEEQKGGCRIEDLPDLLHQAQDADIPIAGLMCIPPFGIEPAPFFALLDKLARDHGLDGRSMGMSGDFETAVKLGATCVRVGTALFGERPAVD